MVGLAQLLLLGLGAAGAQAVNMMERRGEMTDKEMAVIEDLLNRVKDDGDMVHLVVPPPPMSTMDHRLSSPSTSKLYPHPSYIHIEIKYSILEV